MKLHLLSVTFAILCLSWGWVNSAVVRPQDLIVSNATSANTNVPSNSATAEVSSRKSSPHRTAQPDVKDVSSRNPTTTTPLIRTTKKPFKITSSTTTASPMTTTTRRRIPNLFNNPSRNSTILRSRPRVTRDVSEVDEDDSQSEEESVDTLHEDNHAISPEDKKTLTGPEPKSADITEARANPVAPAMPESAKTADILDIIVPEVPEKLAIAETFPETSEDDDEDEKEVTKSKHSELSAAPHSVRKRSLSTLIPLLSSLGIPATLTLLAQAFLAPFAALVLGLLGGIGSSWWLGQLPFLDRFNPFAFPPNEDENVMARSSRNLNFKARDIVSAIETGYRLWQNVQKNEI